MASLGLMGVGAVGTYPALDPSMVLYYHFNNDSSIGENDTHIYDYSGNGNNGTLFGGSNITYYNTGSYINDGYFNYSGRTNYFRVVDLGTNLVAPVITISAWINLNSNGINQNIISREDSSFRLRLDTFNRLNLLLKNSTSGLVGCTTDLTIPLLNTWYWVTAQYDGSKCIFSVNGFFQNVSIALTGNLIEPSNHLYIGARLAGATEAFNGSIDELILYNRTLSKSELSTDYLNYGGCVSLIKGTTYNIFDYPVCSSTYDFSSYNVYNNSKMFIVNFSNAVIDGSGSIIYYGNNSNIFTYAIAIEDKKDIILKNFTLIESSCGSSTRGNHVIYVSNVTNLTLSNLNIVTCSLNSRNIYYNQLVNNSNLINNNLSIIRGGYSTVVDFTNSSNIVFSDNIVNTYNASSETKGVSVRYGSTFVNLTNNQINTRTFSSDYMNGDGIHLVLSGNFINILNNTIKVYNGLRSYGISLESNIYNSFVSNNNVLTTDGVLQSHGIHLDSHIENVTITNNFVNVSGNQSYGIDTGTDIQLCDNGIEYGDCKIKNILINNNTIYSYGYHGYGIFVLGNIFNLTQTITASNIIGNSVNIYGSYSSGIRTLWAVNNSIQNNTLNIYNSLSSAIDVSDNSINNTFINNSLNYVLGYPFVFTTNNIDSVSYFSLVPSLFSSYINNFVSYYSITNLYSSPRVYNYYDLSLVHLYNCTLSSGSKLTNTQLNITLAPQNGCYIG